MQNLPNRIIFYSKSTHLKQSIYNFYYIHCKRKMK